MLETNSIFSNLVLLAIAHNRFYRPLETIKWRSRINLWLNTNRIVQEYCQLNYDTDSCTCGCADESRDEAPKDRSREKKKNN